MSDVNGRWSRAEGRRTKNPRTLEPENPYQPRTATTTPTAAMTAPAVAAPPRTATGPAAAHRATEATPPRPRGVRPCLPRRQHEDDHRRDRGQFVGAHDERRPPRAERR